MSCMDDPDRVRGFLLPRFRRHLPPLITCDFDESSADLCVRCTSVSLDLGMDTTHGVTHAAAWRQQRRALELLALVWLVDPVVWTELLTQLGQTRFSQPIRQRELPAYLLHFAEEDSATYIESVMDILLASSEDHTFDDDLEEVQHFLLAMTSTNEVRAEWDALQIHVRLAFDGTNAELCSSDTLVQWQERSQTQRARLAFDGVDVLKYRGRITTDTIHIVQSLVTRGVPIWNAVLGVFVYGDLESRRDLAQFVDALVEYATRLECRQMVHPSTNEALFSALTCATSPAPKLRTLNLDPYARGTRVEKRSSLFWLLYGLFSQDARHEIECVSLLVHDSSLASELVAITDRLRLHGAPSSELWIPELADDHHITAAIATHDAWVRVPRGHPIRLGLRDDWLDHAFRFDDEDKSFRVLRDDPTWSFIDILVPAYGRCWVERCDRVVVSHTPLSEWRFDRHSIRAMEFGLLRVDRDEARSVCAWLALVGAPLRTLSFRRWFQREPIAAEGLDSETLASFVQSCPDLACLSLDSVSIASLDTVVGIFEKQPCRVRALNLGADPFVDRSSLVGFFDVLGDHTQAITRTLEELAVDLSAFVPEDEEDDVVLRALLRMLDSNAFVLVVHVVLAADQQDRFGTQLAAHRGRLIARRKAPLSMRVKCAFLTAVDLVTSMDKRLFARVFEFAAVCETRTVTVCCPPTRPF